MMKKLLLAAFAALTVAGAQAQDDYDFYKINHNVRLGVGVGVGTEGIGIDVATHLNNYFGVRVGLNFMPGFKFNTDVDVDQEIGVQGAYNEWREMATTADAEKYGELWDKYHYNMGRSSDGHEIPALPSTVEDVNVEANFARTTFDVKFDIYPFGAHHSSFFVTAGFQVGGNKLVKVKGHSEQAKDFMKEFTPWYNGLDANQLAVASQYNVTRNSYGFTVGDYIIPFDENGDVNAGLKVNNFRPYLGLGWGRLVPRNRVGFRFEMGVQFHGKPKAYAEGVDLDRIMNEAQLDDEKNDFDKIMDNFKVWPVLKFSLRGRIL